MSIYTQEHAHTYDPDQLMLPLWGHVPSTCSICGGAGGGEWRGCGWANCARCNGTGDDA